MSVLQLTGGGAADGRPFTAPEHTQRDGRVMQRMLDRVRAIASAWTDEGESEGGFLLQEPDADGHRHWIRVPDRGALAACDRPTVVGFFGRARGDVDQSPIDDLEAGIVDTLETVAGVLCYYDLALAEGGYGNLILCRGADTPSHIHGHALHRRAVELTPRHYHSVRLHSGAVSGPFAGTAPLAIVRTRYYDYDSDPPWLAVRETRP